jgi:ABC-type transport system involved in multi-copper enzyme maturation permease subunit
MSTVIALAGVVIKELYRRKDFYVLFVLTVLITLVMGFGHNFTGQKNVVRDLQEICLLLVWISALAIAVGMTARQLPAERENRTIFPLLAKPVSRAQLILGKFLGCWLAIGIALACFYLPLAVITASVRHYWPVLNYLQAIWLHWAFLGVVIALVLLGSLVFTAASANATLCVFLVIGLVLWGRYLGDAAASVSGIPGVLLYILYFLVPHLEWSDLRDVITQNRPPMGWATLGLSSAYFAGYTAFLLYAAWLFLRRKPLN